MSSAEDYYLPNGRREQNIASRAWADRDRQPWTGEDDDILINDWIYTDPVKRDEVAVSKQLQRTIESCRVRSEKLRKDLGLDRPVIRRTRTETVEYIGAFDDPEDCWWK